jgi:hypothetical protein
MGVAAVSAACVTVDGFNSAHLYVCNVAGNACRLVFVPAGLVWPETDHRRERAPKDEPGLETFTILTTEPNALCAPIHNRMPVILAQDDWSGWLGTIEERKSLLRSFPAERMPFARARTVTRWFTIGIGPITSSTASPTPVMRL